MQPVFPQEEEGQPITWMAAQGLFCPLAAGISGHVFQGFPDKSIDTLAGTRRGVSDALMEFGRSTQGEAIPLRAFRFLAAFPAPVLVNGDGLGKSLFEFLHRAAMKGHHGSSADDPPMKNPASASTSAVAIYSPCESVLMDLSKPKKAQSYSIGICFFALCIRMTAAAPHTCSAPAFCT